MTTPEKKQVVVAFIDLMASGQTDRFGQVLAANYQQHNPAAKDGLRGIQAQANALAHIFSNASASIDDLVVEGDKVVARITWTGTHAAEFLGIPATHKQVTWSGTDWWRIENGKLAEHWDNVDWAHLVQQLQAH